MAIYEKPVRLLFRDMIQGLGFQKGRVFSKSDVMDWFAKNYPKIKEGTISAHLLRFSTNAPSRRKRTRVRHNSLWKNLQTVLRENI